MSSSGKLTLVEVGNGSSAGGRRRRTRGESTEFARAMEVVVMPVAIWYLVLMRAAGVAFRFGGNDLNEGEELKIHGVSCKKLCGLLYLCSAFKESDA